MHPARLSLEVFVTSTILAKLMFFLQISRKDHVFHVTLSQVFFGFLTRLLQEICKNYAITCNLLQGISQNVSQEIFFFQLRIGNKPTVLECGQLSTRSDILGCVNCVFFEKERIVSKIWDVQCSFDRPVKITFLKVWKKIQSNRITKSLFIAFLQNLPRNARPDTKHCLKFFVKIREESECFFQT